MAVKSSDVLDAIRGYVADHGYAPSVRDLGDVFGLSPSTVLYHLQALARDGRIIRDESKSRAIRVVEPNACSHTCSIHCDRRENGEAAPAENRPASGPSSQRTDVE